MEEGGEGESRNQTKPKASRVASKRLIGLARRIERATAMAVPPNCDVRLGVVQVLLRTVQPGDLKR